MTQVRFEDEVVAALGRERDPALRHLDDAALVGELRVAASEVAAASCRWLLLVAELVVRGIWADQGARTPTQWLSWAVSMGESTAREQIRVALRLHRFPRVVAAFREGRLSYSKVRAITRLDHPELEDVLLRFAVFATGAHLERMVADLRGVEVRRARQQLDGWARRSLTWSEPDAETVEIRLRVPKEEGLAAVGKLGHEADRAAREAYRARQEPGADPQTDKTDGDGGTDGDESWRLPRAARMADAFLAAAESLAEHGAPDWSGADHHTLVIHADAEALADPGPGRDRRVEVRVGTASRERGMGMSARVLRRMACDAGYALVGHDDDEEETGVSGRTRRIPPRLRRLLLARDRTCRFPGCGARRGLHAHHIRHWVDDGPTELWNLLLLCAHHHRFVHDRGWTILHDGRGHVRFKPPGEAPLPPALAMPSASAEALGCAAGADALQSRWDGHPPDRDACLRALLAELDRLKAPVALAA